MYFSFYMEKSTVTSPHWLEIDQSKDSECSVGCTSLFYVNHKWSVAHSVGRLECALRDPWLLQDHLFDLPAALQRRFMLAHFMSCKCVWPTEMRAGATSCVGTVTGFAAKVSKVWSDPTWSTSSGFSAGHHCVSNSCPAAPRWLPEGGITFSVCGLTERFFLGDTWIWWEYLLYRER